MTLSEYKRNLNKAIVEVSVFVVQEQSILRVYLQEVINLDLILNKLVVRQFVLVNLKHLTSLSVFYQKILHYIMQCIERQLKEEKTL